MAGWYNFKAFLYPLAMLCNTTIGIGIFALPYIAVKVGLPLMLCYFVFLGSLVTIVHLMFGELALATPDYKRLPGFAKIYLGDWGENLAILANIVGFFGILVAFMVIGGQFLYQFAGPLLGGSETIYSFVYLFFGAILVYFGVNIISRVGLFGLALFFVIFIILAIRGIPMFEWNNLAAQTGGLKDAFLPYGAVLFAMWASSSIPEAEEMLGRRGKKGWLRSIIMASSIVAMLTYLLFIFLIVGITGANTTESAFFGLKNVLGADATSLFFIFGIVTSFTSFIIVGLTLKKILIYDMRVKKFLAWLLVTFIPVILFFAGFKNFIDIFSIVGGVLLGFDGILILLMYQKLRPEKKLLTYPLLAVFFAGMAYEIIYYLK